RAATATLSLRSMASSVPFPRTGCSAAPIPVPTAASSLACDFFDAVALASAWRRRSLDLFSQHLSGVGFQLLQRGDQLGEGLVEVRRLAGPLRRVGVTDDLIARHRVPRPLGLEGVLDRLDALGGVEDHLGAALANLVGL